MISAALILLLVISNQIDCKENGVENLSQAENRNLQGVEILQKDPQKAIQFFKEAQAMDPKNPDFPNNIGIAFLSMGKFKDALPYFSRAVQLDPKYVKGHYNSGVCYQRLEKYQDAIFSYRRAYDLIATPEVTFNLGLVYAKSGDKKNAVVFYKKFLEIAPLDKFPGPVADAKVKIRELSE